MGTVKSSKFHTGRYTLCCRLFSFAVVLGFCLVIGKAFCLQVLEHATWVERGKAQVETTLEVPSYRGSIHDRHGRLLAYSVPQPSLYADAKYVDDERAVAGKLSKVLGDNEKVLQGKLKSDRRFVWLKRRMTDQEAIQISNLNTKGLAFIDEYKRFYPYRQLGGQVLGFVGLDGIGLEGVEKSQDRILRKESSAYCQFRDGGRKSLWNESMPPPEPCEGLGLKLSLDAFLQYLAESELQNVATKYKASAGEIVVLDPRTFEVLAMANWPDFDPNLPGKQSASDWRNRTITDAFEPGSTFKVFLMSAALQEKVVRERDRIFCENGAARLAGHTINDTHPYGWLSMPEVIKYSSNIAAGKIALQLGNERYGRYIRGFGFGNLTNVELPGEIKGLVRSEKNWRPIDLATTGFGQSIGVTALQLSVGIAAIANGGKYSQPVLVKEYLDAEGKTVKSTEPRPSHQVIDPKTAQQITNMMRMVTEEGGTGESAVPEGYSVAGKTGTAQVMDVATKRYASNKYTSLFTGFVPAENPRLVITVVIHEPHGAIYGGVVAAPAFREFAAKALPYLGVLPAPKAEPPARGLRTAQVQERPRTVAREAAPAGKQKVTQPKPVVSAAQKSVVPAADSAQPQKTDKNPIPPQPAKDLMGKIKVSAPMSTAVYSYKQEKSERKSLD